MSMIICPTLLQHATTLTQSNEFQPSFRYISNNSCTAPAFKRATLVLYNGDPVPYNSL